MAWIKRNLFFVVGSAVALALLVLAGIYGYNSYNHNAAAFEKLNEIYGKLQEFNSQKISPGNAKINNVEAARQQEKQIRAFMAQTGDHFQPIAPIPNMTNGAVSSELFASALRRTIDQLQREADIANVTLPPKYGFAFEAQRSLVKFSTSSLNLIAQQLGEVRTISEVLFAARVNALDGIQRLRVSEDDATGPQADYTDEPAITNELAVLTPYVITFRSFGPELAQVLDGFKSSAHGFVIRGLNVQPAGITAGATTMPGEQQPAGAAPTPGKGGLQTVLKEQLLRITMEVEVVKLVPKK